MTRRTYIVRGPDGERRCVLEAGRWYGLDGLPWFVVGTLCRMVEVTTPDVGLVEHGAWKVIGEEVG